MRSVITVQKTPAPEPGFIGEGHTAVEVVAPDALQETDPFVLLMDDRLELGSGRRIGGAHPHAGLETVTLILEGEVRDKDEGTLVAGDAIWMTAGRGIIHNEDVFVRGRARVLQLWIRLPKAERDAEPRFEIIRLATLPIRREPGVEARLYSGNSGALVSATKNHLPVTLVDVHLAPGATLDQAVSRSFGGFVYVLEGAAQIGGKRVEAGEVAWLEQLNGRGDSVLHFSAEARGARVVLYAGERQNEPLVQHGPYVADSRAGIIRAHERFQSGAFVRMSELARNAKGKRHGTLDGSSSRSQ